MKKNNGTFQKFADMPWEPAGENVRRKIMAYDENLMLVYVEFKKGGRGLPHDHFHSQGTLVVSGRFEVYIGEKTATLTAGDTFYIEPDVEHGALCLEDGVLLDTFSPYRADFLK